MDDILECLENYASDQVNSPDADFAAVALCDALTIKATAHRFCSAVQDMFVDDGNWSIYEIDGAAEFFELVGFEPDPDAVKVENDDG